MTTATLTRKSLKARVKDADEGIVELVFATFDVVDHDGDVTVKGAFKGNGAVAISAWNHSSWADALPYGIGEIYETDTEAVADVKFLMDTTHGRDAFYTIKALSDAGIQEWSYSLEQVEAERSEVNGKRVNVLKRVTVKEVSPLLRGAGIDTRTLSTKGRDENRKTLNSTIERELRDAGNERWGGDDVYVYPRDHDLDEGYAVFCVYESGESDRYVQVDISVDGETVTLGDAETDVEIVTAYAPKGASFAEHCTAVVAAVKALTARAQHVVALRAEKGKSISEGSAELLKQLDAALVDLSTEAGDALASLREVDKPATDTATDDDLQAAFDAEFLRYVDSSRGE